jgi:hypothetical protein
MFVDRDSSVGKVSTSALDGLGIEFRQGQHFPEPSRPALRSTQPIIVWVQGLSPGIKRPGFGVDHPPAFSAEVGERL